MGLFDIFKKKNGSVDRDMTDGEKEDVREEQNGETAPEIPADDGTDADVPGSGNGTESADGQEMTFTAGDAVADPGNAVPDAAAAPADPGEDIPDTDGETIRRIRNLCADRAALLNTLPEHRTLLDSLREVYPSVGLFIQDSPFREGMTVEDAQKALNETVRSAARGLEMIKYHQALKHFNDVETDDLKNAWVLLDYYAAITAKSDPAPFIRGRHMMDRTLWGRLEREDIPYLARTKAVGRTPDGTEYILQAAEEDWEYFVELHDRAGVLPQIPAPGEGQLAMMSFRLTKEEFEWKDDVQEDGSRPRVNEFIVRLLENLPQDRLITAGIIDVKTRKLTPVRIKTSCVTMDDRKVIRWRSRKGTERYSGLEKIWTVYSRATGERFPLLDGNYCAWAFSKPEYAESVVKNNPGFDAKVREFDADAFRTFLASLAPAGIVSFRMNMGTRDHPGEILTDDWLGTHTSPPGYEGAALNRLTLRLRQNMRAKENPAAEAAVSTCWNLIAHVLPGTLFLVPFNYKDDIFVNDASLQLTKNSARLMKVKALERSLGRRLKPNEVSDVLKDPSASLNIYDKDMFYGGKDYTLSDPSRIAGPLLPATVKGGGNTFLGGFTDVKALKAVFPMHKRIAVFTWGEMEFFLRTRNSDGSSSSGIVINPGYTDLVIGAERIGELDKAAKEPVKIFLPRNDKKPGAQS